MPPPNAVALTRRTQVVLDRLALLTADQLTRIWNALPAHTAAEQERWAELASPVVEAAQNRAVSTQAAYLGHLLEESIDLDRADILSKATVDLNEPFIALGRSLNAGEDLAKALESGALRAQGVGESSVHWAARATNTAADSNTRVVGWTRTLSGNACEFCQVVSTQRYRTAESASFGHQRCSCGVTPIMGNRDPGRVINRERLDELKESGAVDRLTASNRAKRA